MTSVFTFRRILGTAVAVGLLAVLACGSSEDATPTPTATPVLSFPSPVLPATPTPTPTPLPPGATAVPTATSIPTATPVPGEQPLYGGVINTMANAAGRFDQMHGNTGYGWQGIGSSGNLWNQLLRINPLDRVTVEGDLAESWTLSGDGLTWTFQMRPGVVDHDGNPYTVEDAYYTAFRYIEKPNGVRANRLGCFGAFVDNILDDNGNVKSNPGAEITGPNELTLRLAAPRGAFVNCFTGGWGIWMPDTYIKQIDQDTDTGYRDLDFAKGEVVGTGPFKIVKHEQDNFSDLVRFDQYFRDGLPYLDGVKWLIIPDAATRVAAFRSGRADLFPVFATPTQRDADELKRAMGDEAVFPLVAAPGWRGYELNLNGPPFGPIGDPTADKIRHAIQLAADREEMNDLVHDGIGFFSTPYFIGFDWIYSQQEWLETLDGLNPATKAADIAAAQQLMRDAGFGPDNRLRVNMDTGTGSDKSRGEVTAEQLSEIYIDVNVTVYSDSSVRRDRAIRGEFDMRNESKGASFVDPDAFTVSIHPPFEEGGFTFSGWRNDRWMELRDQELLLEDRSERAILLREMADILWNQDAAWIGMVRPGLLMGHRGNWRGYVAPLFHASNYTFENLWLAP